MKTITTDVVVVGSSPGGMTAALVARQQGLEAIVIEATSLVGGRSAAGDGIMWLPNNHLLDEGADSYAEARAYLETVLGDETSASSKERRDAYIETAPIVASWLTNCGVQLFVDKSRPDFFPQGKRSGRALQAKAIDRSQLGPWAATLPSNRAEFDMMNFAIRGPRSALSALSEFLDGSLSSMRNLATEGAALVGQLLHRAALEGVLVWTDTIVTSVVKKSRAVVGVVAEREGQPVTVLANRAVVLASGGFEANETLREDYLPLPTDVDWTMGNRANQGFAVSVAESVGAALEAMDRAWWSPAMLVDGEPFDIGDSRCRPHSVVVDSAGYRFLNEASPKPVFGRQMYERHRSVRAVPSYLIMDNRHRSRYRLGPWLPGVTPYRALEAGEIVKATSINELADKLGIDQAGLIGTIVRFNAGVHKGKDPDFNRGDTPHDRFLGDSRMFKSPNLGKIAKAPFWGIKIYPGDVGTRGGLLVDANSQVLTSKGKPITGLYACGGAAASIMKNSGPATGAALTAALVDGLRAGAAITGKAVSDV